MQTRKYYLLKQCDSVFVILTKKKKNLLTDCWRYDGYYDVIWE